MYLFKKHFGIPKAETVDFLNIPLDEDFEAFIDPFLIANHKNEGVNDVVFLRLTQFFSRLNQTYIVPNERNQGLAFLDKLHEPNEYYLGYSNSNKGKAISGARAETIFDALRNNVLTRASAVTITNEAHNILLLVGGIGQDIMSDTIANVCKDIFAKFTTEQCLKHNIPTTNFQRHYYNAAMGRWEHTGFDLPSYRGKPIILLPKTIVSPARSYTNHYNNFVAGNYISRDILSGAIKVDNDGKFIKTLKNGTRKAIIKRILETYRKPKDELVQFVLRYNDSLQAFLDYAKEHYPSLDLEGIA